MPSLRKLQQGFAAAVLGADGAAPPVAIAPAAHSAARIGVYRTSIFGNYRNALRASYPVVDRLVGAAFFNTAVEAYVRAQPSVGGDLNVYGATFAEHLAAYAPAAGLPWLPDVARLEWAIDDAGRAPDAARDPEAVLAALRAVPPHALPAARLALDPSCRRLRSAYPILRIWQVNQPGFSGDDRVDLAEGGDALVVRRDADGIALERVAPDDHAWLTALAAGATLGAAIDAAQAADPGFDFGAALATHVASGTITAVVSGHAPSCD